MLRFEPFGQDHVPGAARLAAAQVVETRAHVPALPARWERPGVIEPLLRDLADRGAGIVALDEGYVVGHLLGRVIDAGSDHAWAYVPDIGLAAAVRPDRQRMIETLYTLAARAWVAAGVRTHRIALPANDAELIDTFSWLSFGRMVLDGIRTCEPLTADVPTGALIRRAAPADLAAVASLEAALLRHLLASPTFLVRTADDPTWLRDRLAMPTVAHFLAEVEGRPVAYVRIGPCAEDVATFVRDPATASITGAYTLPEHRRAGIARSLVAAAVDWARGQGYERCAVDFEAMNPEAARFWPTEFQLVSVVMTRTIDARAAEPGG